jgi:predicted PurR-regulated permease PerM
MDIRQQNDWAEFRKHLNTEMDRQVTSNKALLWVSISVLGVLVSFCIVMIVNLMLAVTTLENKINNLNGEMTKLQIDNASLVRIVNHRLNNR